MLDILQAYRHPIKRSEGHAQADCRALRKVCGIDVKMRRAVTEKT